MTKARKDHTCTLCFETIPKGEDYHRQSITPWDHPDNDSFFEVTAHHRCWDLWEKYGDGSDWLFPNDRNAWVETIGERP